jgi:hypothetical protein
VSGTSEGCHWWHHHSENSGLQPASTSTGNCEPGWWNGGVQAAAPQVPLSVVSVLGQAAGPQRSTHPQVRPAEHMLRDVVAHEGASQHHGQDVAPECQLHTIMDEQS